MNISINLLPVEFRANELKRAKFYKIQAVGVFSILITFFFASLIVALRILQSHNMALVQSALSQEEKHLEGFKTTQASLIFLKNRLDIISKYSDKASKQNDVYESLSENIPSEAIISSLSVDRLGNALVLASIPDVTVLDDLFTGLVSSEDSKFSQVSIDSLSRGRDGIFRVSFKLTPK